MPPGFNQRPPYKNELAEAAEQRSAQHAFDLARTNVGLKQPKGNLAA